MVILEDKCYYPLNHNRNRDKDRENKCMDTKEEVGGGMGRIGRWGLTYVHYV